jgi:ATP-binding cassette subfamily F protein uup
MNYSGTLLLVSHDRAFLNNIVTSTMVMEGEGKVREYVGGYDDWLRQRADDEKKKLPIESAKVQKEENVKAKTKLSYQDKRELEAITKKIEQLEKKQSELQDKLADPKFYQDHAEELPSVQQELKQIEGDLEVAYSRWEDLES